MAYTPQTWHDVPATDTPISAARLTAMENGIAAAATMPDLAAKNADPLATQYASFPRYIVIATQSGLITGTLYVSYFIADKAAVINNINVVCVGAATGPPTISRMGIYSVNTSNNNMTLVASAANNVNAFTTGGSNIVTMPLASPSTFTPTYGVTYAFALICVTTGTMPTFQGPSVSGVVSQIKPRLFETQGIQTDLPSSLTNVYNAGGQGKPIFFWTT